MLHTLAEEVMFPPFTRPWFVHSCSLFTHSGSLLGFSGLLHAQVASMFWTSVVSMLLGCVLHAQADDGGDNEDVLQKAVGPRCRGHSAGGCRSLLSPPYESHGPEADSRNNEDLC